MFTLSSCAPCILSASSSLTPPSTTHSFACPSSLGIWRLNNFFYKSGTDLNREDEYAKETFMEISCSRRMLYLHP